jgi:CBS domain-containing protein
MVALAVRIGLSADRATQEKKRVKKNESIKKVLTKDVITTHVGEAVSQVRKTFVKEGFHHMPVVSGKKLIGMVTSSDILGISVEGIPSDARSMDAYLDHQFNIEGLMKKDLKTLPTKSTVADAAEALSEGNFHAVPIVDDEGNLEGLVTSTDLIRFLRDLF